VETTVGETNTYRLLGLSNGNSDSNYTDVDYAIYPYANGTLQVLEKGVSRGTFGGYASGDKLRVAVEGGVVKYRRNGNLIYTSLVAPVYPLLVDAALYTQGSTLNTAEITGSWSGPPAPPATEAVVWTSLVGVSANGGSLTKTAAVGWGNAGAVSTKSLGSGDGYVEITATETNSYRIFGLSNGNTDASYSDIDYGLYLYANGNLLIHEKGTYRGTFGSYASGDKLRVSFEGGVVKYRRNGVVIYTSLVAPVFPLLVDSALYTPNATLTNAVLSGSWQ
jgi:hypothetical protein